MSSQDMKIYKDCRMNIFRRTVWLKYGKILKIMQILINGNLLFTDMYYH